MLNDLAAVKSHIDAQLSSGAADRKSAMHHAVVTTADADARVMILRAWDAERALLRFHTDARSPKVALIGDGAPVGALFYDQPGKLQIRCRGTGWIERDSPAASAAWDASTNFARRCYLGEGPGTVSDRPASGLPAAFEGVEPTAADVEVARENFAILLIEVTSFDWFHLAHTGHRRAIFDTDGARWVTP